jgi:hypothetical protein
LPGARFYEGSWNDPEADAAQLAAALADVINDRSPLPVAPTDLPNWSSLADEYRRQLLKF